jgi:hypothetical protein
VPEKPDNGSPDLLLIVAQIPIAGTGYKHWNPHRLFDKRIGVWSLLR